MGYLSLLLQQDSTFWHFWDSRRQLNSRRTFHFLQTYSCSVLIESHRPKMHLRMWCTKKTHSPTWTFQFCVRMSFETFGTAAKVLNLSWEPKQTLIPLVLQLALGIWIALPWSSCWTNTNHLLLLFLKEYFYFRQYFDQVCNVFNVSGSRVRRRATHRLWRRMLLLVTSRRRMLLLVTFRRHPQLLTLHLPASFSSDYLCEDNYGQTAVLIFL